MGHFTDVQRAQDAKYIWSVQELFFYCVDSARTLVPKSPRARTSPRGIGLSGPVRVLDRRLVGLRPSSSDVFADQRCRKQSLLRLRLPIGVKCRLSPWLP